MSVRSIDQTAGTTDLINQGRHAGIKLDTDDNKIKFKDSGGTVRTLVRTVDSNPFAGVDGALLFAEVTVSSAELLALRATPKSLVAAPGAGKMLSFHCAEVLNDTGAAAYVVGTNDLAIRFKDGTGDIISQTIDTAGLMDATSDIVTHVEPLATDSKSPKADVENQPLVLHNTGAGELTTGDGVLRLKIWYAVITTGW